MLNSKEQFPLVIRWGLLFPIIFLNGWLLWLLFNFLQPFTNILITAALFAFLLNFPIGWLQKLGFPRGLAVTLVFILAILLLATLGLIIIPLLAQQLNELLSSLPQLITDMPPATIPACWSPWIPARVLMETTASWPA